VWRPVGNVRTLPVARLTCGAGEEMDRLTSTDPTVLGSSACEPAMTNSLHERTPEKRRTCGALPPPIVNSATGPPRRCP
jgi:hypothetical protein